MAIQVGDRIPDVPLKSTPSEGMKDVSLAELCVGKRMVIFAVPGAFTPTCSAQHLPGFVAKADEFAAKGVDHIVCISVNDAFVMEAWAKDRNAGGRVTMLADGGAAFTKAMGLDFDGTKFGMGVRSQRYAAVVEDGVIRSLHVEEPMKFEVSSAEAILAAL